MKIPMLISALCIGAASYAQTSLTDLWFIAPSNSSAPDALPTAAFKSPLFDAQSGGNRVFVNTLAGDLSAYHLIFDNTYTDNGTVLTVLWGGNNKTGTGSGSVPGSATYNVGAITVQNLSKAGTGKFQTDASGYYKDTTLNIVNDLTIKNINLGYTYRIGENFKSVNVGGDVNIEDARFNLGSYNASVTTAKSHIGGNVEMSGLKAVLFSSIGNTSAMGTFENPDLQIDGIVNMKATGSDVYQANKWVYSTTTTSALYSYIKVGGVDGNGYIVSDQITNAADGNSRTVIAFNTKSGDTWDFKGYISSSQENTAPTSTKHMDIEMRGEEGGTQILRVLKDGGYMDSNITVYGGTLRLYNTNDLRASAGAQKYNQLIMEGGKFGATTVSASSDGAGNAYFNDIVWNSGVLLVDLVDIDSDLFSIITANTLTLGSADSYVFEFVNELGADLSGYTVDANDFLSITGGITEAQLSKMTGYTSDGQWEAIFDAQTGIVSFVQVPEPSTVAAVLGALALAVAAYRRRK